MSSADGSMLAEIARDLCRPEAYPRPVARVELRQTHISLLFFADDRVYKVRKPVDLGFLDFTTLERRRRDCDDEVRLNRRLAKGVYLGVVPITRGGDGRLCVGGEGAAVEWAVEMVRLPAERMLASLLDRGEVDNQQMNAIAALLAGFHASAATGAGVDEYGSPAAIAANVAQNFDQLGGFVDPEPLAPGRPLAAWTPLQHSFLRERAQSHLDGHRPLLERRVREGRIREGHGDLHAEHLCFTAEGLVVFDCVEFSRALRCGDVAADLAFLAMDLDYRGYPGFAGYLVKRYAAVTGDAELPALEAFYKGYRALVRAKVSVLTAADPAVEESQQRELVRKAMRYVQLAAAYELPPAMILTCGLPACGKSWLARHLAGPLRAAVLHSDVRRKRLSGIAPTARRREAYGEGLYAPEMKAATYRSLLDDALASLRAGHSVIVDATFSKREYRAPFAEAAARLGLSCYVLHVSAPEAVIRERLERRELDAREASDANLDVYLGAVAAFEPPRELPPERVVVVESGAAEPEEPGSRLVDRMIALRQPG
jgi:aminoglycoside phosphotransferase family enzyme/predicted kinase